jgi:hypothetical protein
MRWPGCSVVDISARGGARSPYREHLVPSQPLEELMRRGTPFWPRRKSTAAALSALVLLQGILFFAATQRSFFTHEDCYNFALAQDRSLLRYVATPIIHTYPAPGNRLLFFLVQTLFPLNYAAARTILLVLLGATTVLVAHLVRVLADRDEWWTVAIVTPFAMSLTLLTPVSLWSSGVPVIPALLFTLVALSAWVRSYTGPHRTMWVAVAVLAVAAAGTFYMKFLLIPVYLLFFRLAILPKIVPLETGLRAIWNERLRWGALAVPPALFVTAYVLSGLAARSYLPGERPYLEYLLAAWFHAFVPVAVLNTPVHELPSTPSWVLVVFCQSVSWVVVAATIRRSPLAVRAWALLLVVFVTNMLMVGWVRLPSFGVQIAYWLRYYPEVAVFVPMTLALCLRAGTERRPAVAWETKTAGLMGAFAVVHVLGLAIWGPRLVRQSEGAMARPWFQNLLRETRAASQEKSPLRIVDGETPEYVVLSWMAPYNRVSTVLRLANISAVYNELSPDSFVVMPDGRLARPLFRPLVPLLVGTNAGQRRLDRSEHTSAGHTQPPHECVDAGDYSVAVPHTGANAARLALRIFYSEASREAVALQVDTGGHERRFRDLVLRPDQSRGELIDLATSHVRSLTVRVAPNDRACITTIEIGSLAASDPSES